MLNSARRQSFYDPPETHYFSPEDLALMRHAYCVACQERPLAAWTEAQRLILAKAIVVVFSPVLTEAALVAAAFAILG